MYNLDEHLLLIKNEDKTQSIADCKFEKNRWAIQFVGNSRIYYFASVNVKWLKSPSSVNPDQQSISHQGQTLFNIKKILRFGIYYRIFFADGSIKSYKDSDLQMEHNVLAIPKVSKYLNYYKQVADVVGLKAEDGKNLLSSQIDAIKLNKHKSALAAFLTGQLSGAVQVDKEPQYYFPFGHNLSQMDAVKKAVNHQISIIEGPPGTGKTQTILNIIANLLICGKTVAVVSNNNSATANVFEKLQKYGFDFVAATLGRSENKKTFLENQSGKYPDFSSFQHSAEDIAEIKQSMVTLEQDAREVHDLENKRAELRNCFAALTTENQYFTEFMFGAKQDTEHQSLTSKINSDKLMKLIVHFQERRSKARLWDLLIRMHIWLNVDLPWKWFKGRSIDELSIVLQASFYQRKQNEISDQIASIESRLTHLNIDQRMSRLQSDSLKILQDYLFRKYADRSVREIFTEESLWKNDVVFNAEYPVILSTTHSIRSSLNKQHLYDYVIIDESSQVDLITGILALSCAKNAVIVGDRMQLPNVVPENVRQIARSIFDQFQMDPGYEYSENSLLTSVCRILPDAPRTLLREHYRCHPKIIGFCNQKFYNDQLIILTPDDSDTDVVKIYKTVAGNHARAKTNHRQVDEIRDQVLPELSKLVDPSEIGIISPYRDQANALSNMEETEGIEISTVHKFQGREKDAIIITTVDNEISEFTDNPNLLNVAISRAKRYLRVVISDSEKNEGTNLGDLMKYIQYNNFEIVEGKTCSVFDLLYKDYAEARKAYLQQHRRVSEFDSENLMQAMIEEVLIEPEFSCFDVVAHYPLRMLLKNRGLMTRDELVFALNPLTHTDFVIYNKLDKKPILVIEVDGVAYHNSESNQTRRDQMKNAILGKYGISILRFRTDGSKEREMLVGEMKKSSR